MTVLSHILSYRGPEGPRPRFERGTCVFCHHSGVVWRLEVMKLTWTELFPTSCMNNVHHTIGADSGSRTHTMFPSKDFESFTSAYSITSAKNRNIAFACCGISLLTDNSTTCSNHSVHGHEVYIKPITNADISQSDAAI